MSDLRTIELMKKAGALFATQEYEAALATLDQIEQSMVTPKVEQAKKRTAAAIARLRDLNNAVKTAKEVVQSGNFEMRVEEYLEQRVTDAQALHRKEQTDSRVKRRLRRAERAWRACRFDKATRVLATIPEKRWTMEVRARLTKYQELHRLRSNALSMLQSSTPSGDEAGVVARVTEYLAEMALEGLCDEQVNSLHVAFQEKAAARARAAKIMKLVKQLLVAAGVAALVAVVLVGIGRVARSTYREWVDVR